MLQYDYNIACVALIHAAVLHPVHRLFVCHVTLFSHVWTVYTRPLFTFLTHFQKNIVGNLWMSPSILQSHESLISKVSHNAICLQTEIFLCCSLD